MYKDREMLDENIKEQRQRMALLMLLHEVVRMKLLPSEERQDVDKIISVMNTILLNHLDMMPISTDELEMLSHAFTTINDLFFRINNR